MSLKAFHIVFVAISVVFSVGFGLWSIREYQLAHESLKLWLAIGSFAAAVGLLGYGWWFLKKLKNVSYL